MDVHQPLPALPVERHSVAFPELGRLLQIALAYRPGQGVLQQHLQPEKQRRRVLAAAALQIGPHGGEIAGVLEPVAALVAVGIKQEVEVHGGREWRRVWRGEGASLYGYGRIAASRGRPVGACRLR